MTAYYAAAKYPLHAPPETQWRELSDLTEVAVELVRLARELGKSSDDVVQVFDDAIRVAEYEWDCAV